MTRSPYVGRSVPVIQASRLGSRSSTGRARLQRDCAVGVGLEESTGSAGHRANGSVLARADRVIEKQRVSVINVSQITRC